MLPLPFYEVEALAIASSLSVCLSVCRSFFPFPFIFNTIVWEQGEGCEKQMNLFTSACRPASPPTRQHNKRKSKRKEEEKRSWEEEGKKKGGLKKEEPQRRRGGREKSGRKSRGQKRQRAGPGKKKRKETKTMSSLTSAEKALLHDQANLLPRRKLIPVLCILAVPSLISFIDQNGISTALPTIARDLDADDTISWAGTSSLIANTTFTMLHGRLSDVFGRKAVFVAAVALLALADLMCGLSRSVTTFYVFRGVAGIGGGGIVNVSMIIVSDVVTLEERGKYQGIISAMVGLGSAAGPFIAAGFVQGAAADVSWRGFFYLLAPLGALSALLAAVYLPSKPPTAGFRESLAKVDWLGLLTSSVAVIFLLIPISGGTCHFLSGYFIYFHCYFLTTSPGFKRLWWSLLALPPFPPFLLTW